MAGAAGASSRPSILFDGEAQINWSTSSTEFRPRQWNETPPSHVRLEIIDELPASGGFRGIRYRPTDQRDAVPHSIRSNLIDTLLVNASTTSPRLRLEIAQPPDAAGIRPPR